MKIAIDGRLWHEGGVGRYIRNLVYYLQKQDKQNSYTLYFLDKKGQGFSKSTNFDFEITKSKWHSFSEQWQFCGELNKQNFDLVHFPYFSHPIFYNGPYVITIHDLTILNFTTGKASTKNYLTYLIKKLGYSMVLNHGVKKAEKIIVPSLFVKDDLNKHFGAKDKTVVTYEGVGYEMKQAKLKPVALSQSPFYLYVGNFYPHKNVEALLRAWANLKNSQANLLLVGPNDYFANRIKRLVAKLNLETKVKFIHQVDDGQLRFLYSKCKALILPSLFEGFGLPVVEAAYHNCPLILSDIAVFKEIAPPETIFFNPNNETDLTNKINLADREKLNQTSSDYFAKFSFEKLTQLTLSIYQDCL